MTLSAPWPLHLIWPGWPLPRPLSCSAKRAGSPATGGVLVSHTSDTPFLPGRLQLKGTVSWSQVSCPPEVLVDSGADDNFIDSNLASQFHLPSEPLPAPKDVFALDGKLLARITHHTPPSLPLSPPHLFHPNLWIS